MQKGIGFVREFNIDQKFGSEVSVYLAVIFPNIYTAGMSSYTIHLLHFLFNSRPEILCDRFFYPMEQSDQNKPSNLKNTANKKKKKLAPQKNMQEVGHQIPQKLRSYGHNLLLTEFDVLCFTLQYELDYPNVLFFLQQAGIPLFTDQRITASDLKQGFTRYPLVIAGGPCVRSNPLPLAPFIDFFYTGDLEAILDPFLNAIIANRKMEKDMVFNIKVIETILNLPGTWTFNKNICLNSQYPPIFKNIYEKVSEYNPKSFMDLTHPNKDLFGNDKISIPLARDMNQLWHPTRQIKVEFSDPDIQLTFGDSIFIEIGRGCPHTCKFCMTGAHGKPVRFRSLDSLKEIIEKAINEMQTRRITFIAPSITDHPKIFDLLRWMNQTGIEYSLPSVRIEKINEEFLDILKYSGSRTVTIAPETGTDELREKISKPIKNQTIIENCKKLKESSIKNLKMYFIIGLPDENQEDILNIINLVSEIAKMGFERKTLRCSINFFVPKANTPLEQYTKHFQQFHEKKSELNEKLNHISKTLAPIPQVEIEHENLFDSYLQTLFSIGDIKMSEMVLQCFANNIRNFSGFKRLFQENKISFDLEEYLKDIQSINRKFLPWKFIHC